MFVYPMSHPNAAEKQFYFHMYIRPIASTLMQLNDSTQRSAYVDVPDLLTRTSRAFYFYLDPID
jgi:hypothetical protein